MTTSIFPAALRAARGFELILPITSRVISREACAVPPALLGLNANLPFF